MVRLPLVLTIETVSWHKNQRQHSAREKAISIVGWSRNFILSRFHINSGISIQEFAISLPIVPKYCLSCVSLRSRDFSTPNVLGSNETAALHCHLVHIFWCLRRRKCRQNEKDFLRLEGVDN